MADRDLIIIGGGPAGITAAVYAARKLIDFAMVAPDIGGQAALSGDIENYTGYQFISGPDLSQKFREHLTRYQFQLLEGASVTKIERDNGLFRVLLSEGGPLAARTLIVASGKRPRELGVPGEAAFKNHGLTYCATCDAPLFAGKTVAVVGGGNSAFDAVLQLVKISPKIYVINLSGEPTADPVMRQKAAASERVEVLNLTRVVEVFGDKFVKGIRVESGGQRRELAVEGVFVEAGQVPNTAFLDFAAKNGQGEIEIDCACATSVPGLFAAGDVTSVPEKQIVIAAGEGAKAALSVFRFLSTH